MALRPTMDALIEKTRVFIGDPVGPDAVFTDEEIQDALDARRRDVAAIELEYETTYASGGISQYLTYYAPGVWWEDDPVLQNGAWDALTDSSTPVAILEADAMNGRWVLTASQNPPVYLTGRQYDVNGSAADLLDAWLARIKLEFDFLELGSTFKQSQQAVMVESASKRYRRRQWLRMTPMVKADDI